MSTAADSQAREVDLRKLLENAKKDSESEVKALQEKFEMETKTSGAICVISLIHAVRD